MITKRMAAVILVHLGEFTPFYARDCVHQLRLWNKVEELSIFFIVEPVHRESPFWQSLATDYGVKLVFTDELAPTEEHTLFRKGFVGDTEFRNGYWRHVKERFFYIEELIKERGLTDCVAMEYDVLVYEPAAPLLKRIAAYSDKLAFVMDNETRGHPGFLFIPGAAAMHDYNDHMLAHIRTGMSDMELFSAYREMHSEQMKTLPVITEARNASKPNRVSIVGNTSDDPSYLSNGATEIGSLFDSAVVGQYVGGIDPRNTGGEPYIGYENEGALYSIREMPFEWKKEGGLWRPFLDNVPLATIHVHSKALYCFLSDRDGEPVGNYNPAFVYSQLEPN